MAERFPSLAAWMAPSALQARSRSPEGRTRRPPEPPSEANDLGWDLTPRTKGQPQSGRPLSLETTVSGARWRVRCSLRLGGGSDLAVGRVQYGLDVLSTDDGVVDHVVHRRF